MLGAAELPITVLAWIAVVFAVVGVLGLLLHIYIPLVEKLRTDLRNKRNEEIRKRAIDKALNRK